MGSGILNTAIRTAGPKKGKRWRHPISVEAMGPTEAGGTGRHHQRRVGGKAPVAVEAKSAQQNLLRPGGEKGIAHKNDGPDGRLVEGQD